MADTLEQLARDEYLGESWKNRHKKWPTMSTLMHQPEITVQPYTLDYTDPHEIMAYRAYDIPDWDGISQASWTAAKSIDQEMVGGSSTPIDTKGKRRRREKTCRHILCVFLVLSVVMATAAAVGLTVFLNLHDHGLAEHGHHHHGNHIHANITTEQGIRLSNMFCNLVKRLLRGTDFPVDSGLQSCHTALLFIENSEDVHIEMHVSPKTGYTIKEKILRALERQSKTSKNNRFKNKGKLRPNSMHERATNFSTSGPRITPPRQNINTDKNKQVISATEREDLASSEYTSKATTLPSTTTRCYSTLAKSISEDKTTTLKAIIHGDELEKSVNVDLDKTFVSPDSFEDRPVDSDTNSVKISQTAPPNIVDNDLIRQGIGNFLESTSLSHSGKRLTSATFGVLEKSTSPPPTTLENEPKQQTTTSFLDKATSLTSIIFKHDPMILMTSSSEKTTTLPPITFDDNSKPSPGDTTTLPPIIFDDNLQPSSGDTTTLPPIIFEHDSNQQKENAVVKTSSLLPFFIDTDRNMSTTFRPDKTTTKLVITGYDKILMSINSTTQRQNIVTTTSQVLSSRSDVEEQKEKQGEIIPVATKLFNPELPDLTDSNLISGAVNIQEIKARKNNSPKIVESLMSGGVVKLPFKTNSNFRFLFSSDPKVRKTNSEITEIPNRKEETPIIQNSNKVKKSEKEFIINNTSYKSRQKVSNMFTKKPDSPGLFRTIMLPAHSTKSFIQRGKDLPNPRRRLDLTEFGKTRLKFK